MFIFLLNEFRKNIKRKIQDSRGISNKGRKVREWGRKWGCRRGEGGEEGWERKGGWERESGGGARQGRRRWEEGERMEDKEGNKKVEGGGWRETKWVMGYLGGGEVIEAHRFFMGSC